MGDLITLRPKITSDSDDTRKEPETLKHHPSIQSSVTGEQTSQSYISTEDLYPVREINPKFFAAVQLLAEGLAHISKSLRMFRDGDLISADDALQRFQALLPELFLCRDLGDGLGAMISSIYHAIRNMKSVPLNESQLSALRKAVKRIHTEPFIGFEESVEEIMLLEAAGFEVSPPHLKYAADLLNE
jgi:hypothetical protein